MAIRYQGHKTDLKRGRHANTRLQRAWSDGVAEEFEFVVLEEVADAAALPQAEQLWIERLEALNPEFGFNVYPALIHPVIHEGAREAPCLSQYPAEGSAQRAKRPGRSRGRRQMVAEREDIIRAYIARNDRPAYRVAYDFGVSTTTLYRVLREAGITVNPGGNKRHETL